MTSCDQKTFPALIDRLFLDELPRRGRGRLREHLSSCGGCRDYYDRILLLRRAMSPGAGPLSGEDLRRMADDLLGEPPRPVRRFAAWLAGAATVGAALVALLVLRPSAGFQERGGARPSRAEGVRAFCLAIPDNGSPRVVDAVPAARENAATLRCPLDGAVQFAYTLDAGPARFLAVAGIDSEGRVHSYIPRSDEAGGTQLTEGVVDQPLRESIRLHAAHKPGRVRIVALFATRPLLAADVASALSSGDGQRLRQLAEDIQEIQLEVTP